MLRRSNEAYRTGNVGLSVGRSVGRSSKKIKHDIGHVPKHIGRPMSGLFKKDRYYRYEIWHTKIRTWDNSHICACNISPGDNCPYLEWFLLSKLQT